MLRVRKIFTPVVFSSLAHHFSLDSDLSWRPEVNRTTLLCPLRPPLLLCSLFCPSSRRLARDPRIVAPVAAFHHLQPSWPSSWTTARTRVLPTTTASRLRFVLSCFLFPCVCRFCRGLRFCLCVYLSCVCVCSVPSWIRSGSVWGGFLGWFSACLCPRCRIFFFSFVPDSILFPRLSVARSSRWLIPKQFSSLAAKEPTIDPPAAGFFICVNSSHRVPCLLAYYVVSPVCLPRRCHSTEAVRTVLPPALKRSNAAAPCGGQVGAGQGRCPEGTGGGRAGRSLILVGIDVAVSGGGCGGGGGGDSIGIAVCVDVHPMPIAFSWRERVPPCTHFLPPSVSVCGWGCDVTRVGS